MKHIAESLDYGILQDNSSKLVSKMLHKVLLYKYIWSTMNHQNKIFILFIFV